MLHTDLPIYKKGYDLLSLAADVQLNMPRTFKQSLGKRVHDECVDLLLEIGYARQRTATTTARAFPTNCAGVDTASRATSQRLSGEKQHERASENSAPGRAAQCNMAVRSIVRSRSASRRV